MTIYSFDTPIFNIKSGALYIYQNYVIDGKLLTHKHSYKKNYKKNHDFSQFVPVNIRTIKKHVYDIYCSKTT